MAKFSQYTLNQVAGFNNQILAEQLVYNQKDFWNFAWNTNTVSGGGWTNTTTPIDLTGATISAQIIRRQITELEDSRTGINFTIVDYPFPAPITTVAETVSSTNTLVCLTTVGLFEDQPIEFTGTVFGGVATKTTYYVKEIVDETHFTISNTQGGSVKTLTTATGTMIANRVAPSVITLPISNRDNANGTFTMTIDDDTWDVIAGDPELDINATNPVCFTGRLKISFPASGSQPAYDEQIFLLFLIVSDGVVN